MNRAELTGAKLSPNQNIHWHFPDQIVDRLANIYENQDNLRRYPRQIGEVWKNYINLVPALRSYQLIPYTSGGDRLFLSHPQGLRKIELPPLGPDELRLFINTLPDEVQQLGQLFECKPEDITEDIMQTYRFTREIAKIIDSIAYSARSKSEVHLDRTSPTRKKDQRFLADKTTPQMIIEAITLNYFRQHKNSYKGYPVDPEHGQMGLDSFLDLIDSIGISKENSNYGEIVLAYTLAYNAHTQIKQLRVSGEAYFNHPRETAIILIRAGVRNWQAIAGALDHDVEEDTDYLASTSRRKDESAYLRLKELFTKRYADIVFAVTAPDLSELGIENPDMYGKTVLEKLEKEDREEYLLRRKALRSLKKEQDQKAYEKIKDEECPAQARLIKMADHIQNLQTLDIMPLKKQIAKLKTIKKYLKSIYSRSFKEGNFSDEDNDPQTQIELESARKILVVQLEAEIAARETILLAQGISL